MILRSRPQSGIVPTLFLVALMTALSVLTLSPVAHAGKATVTVNAYSDSTCKTAAPSISLGTTVYAGVSWSGGSGGNAFPFTNPLTLNYTDPSAVTVKTVSGINLTSGASGSYCDTTGYFLPTTESTGNWTVTFTDSSTPHPNTYSATFAATAPVPDLPLGVIFLILPVVAIYAILRGRAEIARR